MLDKSIVSETSELIENSVTAVNCLTYLSFSKIFRLKEIFKTSLRVIERWFTTVADSEEFLELDFTCVSTLLSSSELLIDSELQVFDVLTAWLNYKRIERSKRAKNLLERVRLSALTNPALKNILDNSLWIIENDKYTDIINKAIRNKNQLYTSAAKSINRYCSQENFNILLVGGENSENNTLRNASTIDANNLSIIDSLSPFKYERSFPKVVCVKGEIYVFNGYDQRHMPVRNVEKFSPVTNTWNVIAQINDRRLNFCACSFTDSIYVFGGFLSGSTNSCLVFNTTNKAWTQIAKMNEGRHNASCVVFEGRIFVTGGLNENGRNLDTVEAYDHIDNSWINMPKLS